jgi:hypothetical protein
MIHHEAIRQLCPSVVTIVNDNPKKVQVGFDGQGRPIYDNNPLAYDAKGERVFYDLAQATAISKMMWCKQQAKRLLSATDWSALPDVGLVNAEEFTAYRAAVRALMITPVEDPTWPAVPTAIWS